MLLLLFLLLIHASSVVNQPTGAVGAVGAVVDVPRMAVAMH
jgi:hypothetical protein